MWKECMVICHGDRFRTCCRLTYFDSKLTICGNVVEYSGMVVGFSQGEWFKHDVTLSLGFSQKEGSNLVEFFSSISIGFKVNGWSTHDYKVVIVLASNDNFKDGGVR